MDSSEEEKGGYVGSIVSILLSIERETCKVRKTFKSNVATLTGFGSEECGCKVALHVPQFQRRLRDVCKRFW